MAKPIDRSALSRVRPGLFLACPKLYDRLAAGASLCASHYLSAKMTLERLPYLRQQGLIGGMLHYDGQFDDARLNVALALTAIERGAVVLNHIVLFGSCRMLDASVA